MRLTPRVVSELYPSLGERLRADLGRDAAFDLYLAFLSEQNVWDRAGLVFKGGTAVRKFHCTPDEYHRISYDLDFSLERGVTDDALVQLMSSQAGRSPLSCRLSLSAHNRLALDAPFLNEPLSVACDVSPMAPIQPPAMLPLLRRPMHDYYDVDMSHKVPVMTVDETVAEKLTRWHIRPFVRDLYDLTLLRPHITDPATVAKLYVIKGHRSFHNPAKGPTTTAPRPVDWEGIIYTPALAEMDLDKLQLDVPTSPGDKRALVASILEGFPEQYGFCLDEMRGDLERWGDDVAGAYIEEVDQAAQALRTNASHQQPRPDTASAGEQPHSPPGAGSANYDAASYRQSLGVDDTPAPGSAIPLPSQDGPVSAPQTRPFGADTADGTPCDNQVSPASTKCRAGHTPLPRET